VCGCVGVGGWVSGWVGEGGGEAYAASQVRGLVQLPEVCGEGWCSFQSAAGRRDGCRPSVQRPRTLPLFRCMPSPPLPLPPHIHTRMLPLPHTHPPQCTRTSYRCVWWHAVCGGPITRNLTGAVNCMSRTMPTLKWRFHLEMLMPWSPRDRWYCFSSSLPLARNWHQKAMGEQGRSNS
jgi:hypothetical protein